MIDSVLPRGRGWRSLLEPLFFLAVVVAAMLALDQLARWQLREYLADSASATLGALAHGDTPYRWAMTSSHDVIAGRAFGTEAVRFERTGMHVTSTAQPIEIGLVLAGTIDLERYPIIEIGIDADIETPLVLSLREALDRPLCSSAASTVVRGSSDLRIDFLALDWSCDGKPAAAPTRAAMLRIGLDLPRGSSARIDHVRVLPLLAMTSAEIAAATPVTLQWSPSTRSGQMQWSDVLSNLPADAWPLLQLQMAGRVEQSLVAIDQVRGVLPAAIVIAEHDWPRVAARAAGWQAEPTTPSNRWLPWALVASYALVLAWIRLRPLSAPRAQALAELLGVTVIPLTLVIGGCIGNDISAPTATVIALTLLFAASLLIGSAPRHPAARTGQRGWAIALATFAASIVVVLALGDRGAPWQWPTPTHALLYLAWAGVQQFLICVIVAERFDRLSGSPLWALPAAAMVFALLHTPNAMLMQFTLLGGLVWIWNWQRHRALLANIVAHAASGLALSTQLPIDWLRSAEVSARYFLF